jgi:hypothetical protein
MTRKGWTTFFGRNSKATTFLIQVQKVITKKKYEFIKMSFGDLSIFLFIYKGYFFKFGVEVGVGESIENAPLM